MKKIAIFLFLCFILLNNTFSQSGTVLNKFQNRKSHDRSKAIIVGVKAGLNMASMRYTDINLKDLPKNSLVQTLFGVFVEIPVTNKISLAPELSVVNRGVSISYIYRNGTPVDYDIRSTYLDLRLPVAYRLILSPILQPYAFIAPDLALIAGGTITLKQDESIVIPGSNVININQGNMRSVDFSAIAGIGTRYYMNFSSFSILLKVEAGYNFGFINTLSDLEMNEQAVANNINAYNINGKRFNRGFEFAFYIGLPLKFAEKGCSDFGNNHDRFY